jgi:hypothetical protein
MILFDLSHNDAEALLHHCETFRAATGDSREDRRLQSALGDLARAIHVHLYGGAGDLPECP